MTRDIVYIFVERGGSDTVGPATELKKPGALRPYSLCPGGSSSSWREVAQRSEAKRSKQHPHSRPFRKEPRWLVVLCLHSIGSRFCPRGLAPCDRTGKPSPTGWMEVYAYSGTNVMRDRWREKESSDYRWFRSVSALLGRLFPTPNCR
jgi:hypothetical protein